MNIKEDRTMNKSKFATGAILALITAGLAATALTPVVAAELQHKSDQPTMQQTKALKDEEIKALVDFILSHHD